MNDQRSSDRDAPLGDGSPGDGPGEPSISAKRPRWTPIVVSIAVLALAAGVAGALFLSQTSKPPRKRAAPAQGLACPFLHQAADAYDSGDLAAFQHAASQAAEVAQGTLQTSGQAFGAPERVALELSSGSTGRAPQLLSRAVDVCSQLGLWSAPSPGATGAGNVTGEVTPT